MDTSYGPTIAAVTPLNRSIREYSLFQGVQRVLDRLRKDTPEPVDDEVLYERIEFHANPSLGHAGSDIDRLEFFKEHGVLHARLHLNLLSLIGAGSPLPAFYAEQALGDRDQNNPTRAFLNLFNHRLHRLLFPIWQKYRYHSRFQSGAEDALSERLFALIGLGGQTIRDATQLNWKRLLPYLGLLSLRAHSAALIESVLRYYFKHAELYIEQCLQREMPIPRDQQNQLGHLNHQLGESLVLGEHVTDGSSKFRVHIQQLSWERFHDLLPIGSGYQPLCALVDFSLRDPLDYDIRLQLRQEEIQALCIGQASACLLGWTSWLGRDHADGVVTLNSLSSSKDGN
ncbi:MULTISPECIES: type VI secretion system baseplate subunit TssG [unclassified Pseudomonas]|uniref:type VI secretion system baseplate subunit TssG n=1 Tax=unclassified Pseudomonas TaxID=196821 RepID=UPI00128D919D|nr:MULTISPECIES: type VI secretion system baseplate subunit TssG [unclassified Pseudomonas]MPQ71081.1 type VI secretion system baseplate subunit TssG [Pseudomonas sp. MWU12-2323]